MKNAKTKKTAASDKQQQKTTHTDMRFPAKECAHKCCCEKFADFIDYVKEYSKQIADQLVAMGAFGPAASAANKPCCENKNVDPRVYLMRILLEKSKYDFSGLETAYRRNPENDGDGFVSYDIMVGKTKEDEDSTVTMTEILPVKVYPDSIERTVKEFDDLVANIVYFDVPMKSVKPQPDKNPVAEKKEAPKKPLDKKPEPEKVEMRDAVMPSKRELLDKSKYDIPPSRVKFYMERFDKKHGKAMMRVEFYPKSYKSYKAGEEKKTEKGFFGVTQKGVTKNVVRAFDTIVASLRDSKFQLKK